jgi:hypothetical protein
MRDDVLKHMAEVTQIAAAQMAGMRFGAAVPIACTMLRCLLESETLHPTGARIDSEQLAGEAVQLADALIAALQRPPERRPA